MNMLGKKSVLNLNRSWLPIGVILVEKALEDLMAGTKLGMYISSDNSIIRPVTWAEWLELPAEEPEFTVHTVNRAIRIPKVVISINYNKVLMKKPPLTNENIYRRDGHRCAYTGKRLSQSSRSIDHVTPTSRGGAKNSWLNQVACDKEINFIKGNKTPAEAGLVLRIKPTEPKVVPVGSTIYNSHDIKEWDLFLNN